MTILLTLALWLGQTAEVSDSRLHNAIAAATVAIVAHDATEARELYRLAYLESRWHPRARSTATACGIWQQQPRWKRTTCHALQTRPIHAALLAVQTSRRMRQLCGSAWVRCYQRGPNHPSNAIYRIDRLAW